MEAPLSISNVLLFGLVTATALSLAMLLSLRRLHFVERRKWWRQWRNESHGSGRNLAMAAFMGMVVFPSLGWAMHQPWFTLFGGACGIMLAVLLDDSVRRYIETQTELRHREMRHWEVRKPLQHRAAYQANMRLQELDRVQSISLRRLMDPHFLFNALNGIMHDMMKGEWHRAMRHLKAFNRLAERHIQSGHDGWITLNAEWATLTDYLELEIRRLDRPIAWELSPLPLALGERKIPALLIQPLVENALWHGLGGTSMTGPGSILVHAKPHDGNHVCIEVVNAPTTGETEAPDPVRPAAEQSDRRHATDLIRQRLRLLDRHGDSGFVIRKDRQKTVARLIVPCS